MDEQRQKGPEELQPSPVALLVFLFAMASVAILAILLAAFFSR